MTRQKVDRILFATDFLGSSRLALDYAVAFAYHFKAMIIMLHAVELPYSAREAEMETHRPSLTRKHARERLETVANGVRSIGIEVKTSVEEGIPSDVILQAVEQHSADLLVLGVHGVHRGLAHLLIGSNTEKIVVSATCPTMTVGAHVFTGVDPGLHFKEILYFSDFTPEAAAAGPYAAFLGKEFGAPIDVCQLMPEVAENNAELRQDGVGRHDEAIGEMSPESARRPDDPSLHLDRGFEVDEMIERAQSQHAGLIVLGVHTESQLRRHFHTSFAYRLLAQASCPVISIRH